MDMGKKQAKHIARNGKKEITTSPLCRIASANAVISDQDKEPILIWIMACPVFLTIGIS